MKTVLVTGATGFVGSHALEALMQVPGIKLVAAVRRRKSLLPDYAGEVRIGDLSNKEDIARLLSGIDVVVHCAAWTSLYKNKNNSQRLFYEPTIEFIHAAISSGVKHFINISSTSAAAPLASADPDSPGIARSFWPHLTNVVRIEQYLQRMAGLHGMDVTNLRLGLFVGQRYALGLLPILLPRLKTHLVPWVAGGKTSLPLVDGRDIGQAIMKAAMSDQQKGYQSYNIVGPTVPTVREVIQFLHDEFGYPLPHFSVPFGLAYPFAWLMEMLDVIMPFEPLVTRSIIHILEETHVNNCKASQVLGYEPRFYWQDAIRAQVEEMKQQQTAMSMARPTS